MIPLAHLLPQVDRYGSNYAFHNRRSPMTAPHDAPGLPGPLEGVRVLDFGEPQALYATKLLADLGADVLLVEPPGGVSARRLPPFYHDTPGPARSLSFWFFNTSKRAVTCNLQSADGVALFSRLLGTARVVVAGGPPERLPGGSADIAQRITGLPGLIWASVSGFGDWGPHADWLGPDLVGVAMSGIMTLAGYPDRAPVRPPGQQGLIAAGLQAAQGILMALRVAERTGLGQRVEVSMQEALSLAQETAMQYWDMQRFLRQRRGDEHIVPAFGTYPSADGHVYAMVTAGAGAPFATLVEWMAETDMAGDLRDEPFSSLMERDRIKQLRRAATAGTVTREERAQLEHTDELVSAFFLANSKRHLYEEGQRRRLLIAPVSSAKDLAENPQLRARSWFQSVGHAELGETITYPGPPFRLTQSPWRISRRPPLVGEHNREIWISEMGLSERELTALAAANVI